MKKSIARGAAFVSLSLVFLFMILLKNEDPASPCRNVMTEDTSASENASTNTKVAVSDAGGAETSPLENPRVTQKTANAASVDEGPAMSIAELRSIDHRALLDIAGGTNADSTRRGVHVGFLQCLAGLTERTGIDPLWDDTRQWEWKIVIRVLSKDGVGTIENAWTHEAEPWPEYFDQETKDCYLQSLRGYKFETTHDFAYNFAMPVVAISQMKEFCERHGMNCE